MIVNTSRAMFPNNIALLVSNTHVHMMKAALCTHSCELALHANWHRVQTDTHRECTLSHRYCPSLVAGLAEAHGGCKTQPCGSRPEPQYKMAGPLSTLSLKTFWQPHLWSRVSETGQSPDHLGCYCSLPSHTHHQQGHCRMHWCFLPLELWCSVDDQTHGEDVDQTGFGAVGSSPGGWRCPIHLPGMAEHALGAVCDPWADQSQKNDPQLDVGREAACEARRVSAWIGMATLAEVCL